MSRFNESLSDLGRSAVDAVRGAFDEFRRAQIRLATYGAADTEPDCVMQLAVAVHVGLRAGRHRMPSSADEWQLYTASLDCGSAAAELTQALRKLIDVIGPLFLVSMAAKNAVRSALWRLSL